MANLKTTYLGLELKNPLIVGASSLSSNPNKLGDFEKYGAGAIVFKSLFEEQIQLEELKLQNTLDQYSERSAEMTSLYPTIQHAGAKDHLLKLEKAKRSVNIPLIASLNAVYSDTWVSYAQEIEKTGVDAIELNFYSTPRDFDLAGSEIIQNQINILKDVRKAIKIPIAVKISPFYTNPLSVINSMDNEKVGGFVLFNKLFQPDINIEKEALEQSIMFSSSNDNRLSIRFTGLLYGNVSADICSSSGILTSEDAIKALLAGASAFQVVSTLYSNGIDYIPEIISGIEAWMDKKGYAQISDFRGKLARKNLKDPFAYRRSQYVDIIMKSEDILKNKSLL